MMPPIVRASLQLRFLVVTLAAVLMLVGLVRLREMPVDVLPEFAPPYVEVQTEALGLSASEVEELVTLNLEELMHGVPWLQTIRSRSVPGLSSIILIFQPGTDIYRARQMVQERLILARHIPNVSTPPVILQPLSATSRVMIIGLSSKDVSPIELGVLARWKIRPALMGVPGVANVSTWGQRERQLQVRVDPELLRAYGLSLDQIVRSAGDAMWFSPLSFLSASTPGTGGWLDLPQQRMEVRHVLPISTPQQLGQVAIPGSSLRLGDVAEVVEDHQPLIGDGLEGGEPSLLLVVEKFPGANTLDVTRALEATLATLRPGLPGVQLDPTVFRPASFIELALGNLTRTLLVGASLAALAMVALFLQLRLVLISLVAIPLSLAAAALVLQLRGATLNAMTLAGLMIALGVLVDDAVVALDNLSRRVRQARLEGNSQPTASIVLASVVELRRPLVFATLVVLLPVLPVLLLQGIAGALFQPLAVSYVLAVLASLLVATTVTPALSLILSSTTTPAGQVSPLVRWLQRGYAAVLTRSIRTPLSAFVAAGMLVVASLAVMPFLRLPSLVPAFREPQLMIQWEGPAGTSQLEMNRITAQLTRELRMLPGVSDVGAHIGRALLGDEVVGINAARIWVSIAPTADYAATLASIQAVVDRYPGRPGEVQPYVQQTLREVQTGSNADIVVRVFGPEWGVLRAKAEEVRRALSAIPGVVDLQSQPLVEEPQIEIAVDFARAQRYGLNPGDVRRAASTLVNGLVVGSLFEQQKVFDVVVWSTPETRNSLTAVRELLIDTPSGERVRLEDVADVRVAPTLSTISREAVSRRLDVALNVRGRDPWAVARDVDRALQGVAFPLEYHAEVLGEYAARQAAQQRLLGGTLVAVLGTFLLLQACFQSWRLALLACLTLPWGVAGGLVATALVGNGVLSLGSLIGLLAVLGIAIRNGVVLISRFQDLGQKEGALVDPALVIRAASERLVPILITAVTTGLALAPAALFGALPGLEVALPLAIVVLGGLVTSSAVNLLVLPTLYLLLARRGAAAVRDTPGPALVPATA